ncbi:MAG: TonB-dependent siderophore receptor [Pseudomonadota bacterium]|nr:TonB-dependent siderophore receptor [Pseudomonadota bacterium]
MFDPHDHLADFALKPALLALACTAGAVQAQQPEPAPTQAQAPAPGQATPTLKEVQVTAPQYTPYNPEFGSLPQLTAPLLDTPKSITVIPQEVLQERGVNSLADVLRTTPGITLGSGEGGTPMGDRPFIRGYEASTDIMIDGVRDLGRFAHEAFNIEQVEILKGPGSAYTGRGSTGGSINLVSKKPLADNAFAGSVGLGTDSYRRLTVDGNWRVSEGVAVRLNAMSHDAHVPGRDTNKARRWGVAPSVTFGMDGPTQATLSYYGLRAKDTPDLGHPFDTGLPGAVGRPVRVDRDNFYGVKARDARQNDTDMGTLEVRHRFGNGMRLQNTTRYGESINQYIMTRPTIDAASGMVNRDVRTGNHRAKVLANQTDLHGDFTIGGVKNDFVLGLEYAREQLHTGSIPAAAGFAMGRTPLLHPTPGDAYGGPGLSDFGSDYDTLTNRTTTKAAYAFTTARFSPQWEANLGLRYDNYHVTNGTLSNKAKLWNYQLGLVYKPAPNGSVYVAYGTSSNPSGETQGMSGGADGAAGGNLGSGRDQLKPEKNRSIEIGTKWDVLNNRLSLTAAVFRTQKTNQRALDPITGDVALIGSNRTTGFELGAAGNLTPAWTLFAGYTWLDPKMLNSGGDGANNGKRLKFIAKQAFSAWSTYKITPELTVGGGATYMSSRWMNDANTLGVPAYWRYDAMVSYRVNKHVDLQLNLLNIGNRTIYEGSHVGLFANVGPGRSAMLTANFKY